MTSYDFQGKTRDDALSLLHEFVTSDSLRRHCYSVETAMRALAGKFGEDVEAWGMLGLIHDFDYEQYPDPADHTRVGAGIVVERGFPDWLAAGLLAHGANDAYPRTTLMDKALFSVDELTGFISAVALVRPSKAVADVKVSSVKKKMKDKAFAAAIHREELVGGAEELGVPFDDHVAFVIQAMADNAAELGLGGPDLAG